MPPGKKPPGKMSSGKLPPGNKPLENCPLLRKIFVASNIILPFFIFKLFIVTSFRGVSRTPAASIIDILVTVVNGSN